MPTFAAGETTSSGDTQRTNADQATEVLIRLQGVTPLGQTFSGGVATWDRDETSDELVARADVALYAAKAGGRDRVVAAERTAYPDMAVSA